MPDPPRSRPSFLPSPGCASSSTASCMKQGYRGHLFTTWGGLCPEEGAPSSSACPPFSVSPPTHSQDYHLLFPSWDHPKALTFADSFSCLLWVCAEAFFKKPSLTAPSYAIRTPPCQDSTPA